MSSSNNGFTSSAQDALRRAHEIVQQKRHSQLDVEHILLALLTVKHGPVPAIIGELGGDLPLLIRWVEAELDATQHPYAVYSGMTTNIHISMRAQRVVSEAAKIATQLGAGYIGGEHLLLAIADEPDGRAAHRLAEAGLDKARLTTAIQRLQDHGVRADVPGAAVYTATEAELYERLYGRITRMQMELDALQQELDQLRRTRESS